MTLIAITALVLLGVGIAFALRAALLPSIDAAERMGEVELYGYAADAPRVPQETEERGLSALARGVGEGMLRRYPQRVDEDEMRRLVASAGLYQTSAATIIGASTLGALVLGGLFLLIGLLAGSLLLTVASTVALLLGWRLPKIVLERRAAARQAHIDRDMPELVDLLTVTVEAGIGFNASLQLAGGRMSGPLGEELILAMQQQRMGLSTSESLGRMMERVDSPAMRSFVRSVLQGEQLGVSIGQILRNLATEMRARRRTAAEERAQKAPVKMLFPLVLLIFPSLFIVILYPAMAEIGRAFE